MAETNEGRETDTVPTARTLGSVEAPSHGGGLTRAASAALFDTAMGAGMGRPSPVGLIDLLARRPVEDRKAAIDDLNFRVGNRRVTRMIVAGSAPIAHTGSGRQLLARELSHVQQRQNGDRRLQRKEIDKALVASNRGGVADGDWLAVDREEWELARQGGLESMLSPTNTFMRAVYYNTQNLHPQEYQTVRERHDYYDLISYVLEFDKGT